MSSVLIPGERVRARELRRTRRVGLLGRMRRLDWLLLSALAGVAALGLDVIGTRRRRPRVRASSRRSTSALGALALCVLSFIDVERFRRFEWPLYIGTIALVAAVFALGFSTRGSRRWIQLPFFQFQPSELGKLTLLLALAAFIARNAGPHRDAARSSLAASPTSALPAALVFIEPDFGTALVYVAVAALRAASSPACACATSRCSAASRCSLVGGRAVGAAGRRRAGAQAVPGRSPHVVPASRAQHAGRGLQPVPGQDRRRLGRPRRARQVGRDADAQRLPAGAPHRLRVRRAGRGARASSARCCCSASTSSCSGASCARSRSRARSTRA